MSDSTPRLPASVAIVMPAYNEEASVAQAVRESLRILSQSVLDYEVIVVDDASTDGTAAIVSALAIEDDHVRLLEAGRNIGANAAALLGMRAARCDVSFFIASDLQIHPDQLLSCLPLLDVADYVCTWRRPRSDPWHRRWMARVYNVVVRLIVGLPAHDVDSGILVRKEVIAAVASQLRCSSDFLPVELLARAMSHGYRVREVTIVHRPRSAGKPGSIVPLSVLRTLGDLARSLPALRRLRRDRPATR